MSTYHDILGVQPGASQEEIKAAFRERALETHPDRADEGEKEAAQQEFLRVREAFEMLSDGEEGQWTRRSYGSASESDDDESRPRGSRRSYKERWRDAKKVRVSKDIVDRVQGLSGEYRLIRQKNKVTVPLCAVLVASVYVFDPMTLFGTGLYLVDLLLSGLVGGAYGLALGSVWAYLEIFIGENGA
ncbi:MAG: J domain-containing protein [Salinibacter sp.]